MYGRINMNTPNLIQGLKIKNIHFPDGTNITTGRDGYVSIVVTME
tara:strand:+ start:341 stop:475 length:135 start_codon:yes stop_codon:yes gene_type:complete